MQTPKKIMGREGNANPAPHQKKGSAKDLRFIIYYVNLIPKSKINKTKENIYKDYKPIIYGKATKTRNIKLTMSIREPS